MPERARDGAAHAGEPGVRSVDRLPQLGEALAVCAHPDDESFGLGAVLGALSDQGTRVRVLCFTRGEASTLGETRLLLGEIRAGELAAAAAVLGVEEVTLLKYADGHLGDVPVEELAQRVDEATGSARVLVVFDEGGISGHPDHRAATAAALLAADRRELSVLAWVVPDRVADTLNAEHGTSFVGRSDVDVDYAVEVDRQRQRQAIACHASQSADNHVLWRRLELSGAFESLRWLRPPPWTAVTTGQTVDSTGFEGGA